MACCRACIDVGMSVYSTYWITSPEDRVWPRADTPFVYSTICDKGDISRIWGTETNRTQFRKKGH